MASKDFIVNLIADASKAVAGVDQFGKKLKKTLGDGGTQFSGFGSVASGALAAIGISNIADKVGDFLVGSGDAYKEAQASQARLEDAYKRFPAVADVSLKSLRDLNTELATKTKFDDDATASGQSVLAGFKLTGSQITTLTPLLQDYAAKTGKDLPTAAQDLGKAILGQGKALKGIGVEFSDTGSEAGNFEELVGSLTDKVGGFAENEGKTAAGTADIMKNKFGEVQETLGAKLMPVFMGVQSFLVTDLIPAFSGLVGWVSENTGVLQIAAAIIGGVLAVAFGVWAVSIWASTVALLANPVTWIIIAIVALIAIIILLVMNWDTVVKWITDVWGGFIGWITDGLNAFGAWWVSMWAGFGGFVTDVWNGFIGWIVGLWNGFIGTMAGIGAGLTSWWNGLWSGLGDFVQDAFRNVGNFVIDGLNTVIGMVNGALSGINDIAAGVKTITGGAIDIKLGKLPKIPRLATGGVTSGPMMAIIGDNAGGREVVEPLASYERKMAAQYAAGQATSGGRDRPIYADGIGLIGWIKELANGEAKLVFAMGESGNVMTSKMGKQR